MIGINNGLKAYPFYTWFKQNMRFLLKGINFCQIVFTDVLAP